MGHTCVPQKNRDRRAPLESSLLLSFLNFREETRTNRLGEVPSSSPQRGTHVETRLDRSNRTDQSERLRWTGTRHASSPRTSCPPLHLVPSSPSSSTSPLALVLARPPPNLDDQQVAAATTTTQIVGHRGLRGRARVSGGGRGRGRGRGASEGTRGWGRRGNRPPAWRRSV